MMDDFEARVRTLLQQSASLVDRKDAQHLLPSLAPADGRAGGATPGGFMGTRALFAAAVVAVMITAVFAVVRIWQSPAVPTTASPSAPAPLSCPATSAVPKVTSSAEPAGDVVAFAPTAGLLCDYAPLPGAGLVRATPIKADQLAEVRTVLDALPGASRSVRHCAMDDGSAYLIVLSGSTEQHIRVEKTGCQQVSDGVHLRESTAELRDLLARLS
jgi:hypothetical protein